jgi:hypothetical protein
LSTNFPEGYASESSVRLASPAERGRRDGSAAACDSSRDPRHQGDHTNEHRRDHHHHDHPADGFTRSRVQEDYVLLGLDGKYWSAMGGRIGTEAEALAHLAPEIGKPDAASEAATAAKPLTPPPAA